MFEICMERRDHLGYGYGTPIPILGRNGQKEEEKRGKQKVQCPSRSAN
jgi:hypothetical protein